MVIPLDLQPRLVLVLAFRLHRSLRSLVRLCGLIRQSTIRAAWAARCLLTTDAAVDLCNCACASPGGRPPAPVVELAEPASNKQMRRLFEKDASVDMALSGLLALTLPLVSVIFAICVTLGFAAFGALLIMAMHKGYNINDAGYQVALGEGETCQEH